MELTNQMYRIDRWEPEKDVQGICEGYCICYQTPVPDTYHDQKLFIDRCLKRDPEHPHESPLEHSILSVTLRTNRGVTHELVRHRLASPNQESTRYCNYSKGRFNRSVLFVEDPRVINKIGRDKFIEGCEKCEQEYFYRLDSKCSSDEARGALNNDVCSRIKITTNYREWRHIFQLRCDDVHAHYQMVALMTPLLNVLQFELPMIFGDVELKEWTPVTQEQSKN